MSHFTKVATKIVDVNALKRALDTLGIQYTAGTNLSWNAYADRGTGAVVVINKNTTWNAHGNQYRINQYGQCAFIPDETGAIQIVYDDHFHEIDEAAITSIKQQYSLEVVKEALAGQGLTPEEVVMQPDGSIKVVARGYGVTGVTEVTAKVDKAGIVEAGAAGFKGEACLPVVAKIQQLVGGQVIASEPTSEFYDPESGGEYRDVSDYL